MTEGNSKSYLMLYRYVEGHVVFHSSISPFSRNQRFNQMCDKILKCVLSCAQDRFLPVLLEAFDMIKGVPKEVADLKAQLKEFEDFINDADRMAEAEEDNNTHNGIKARVKQLREATFRMEDVIDEYMIYEGQQPLHDPGCEAIFLEYPTYFVKAKFFRLQTVYEIRNIKSRIREIKDTSGRDGFQIQSSSSEQGSSSSTANNNAVSLMRNLREAPLYMDEDDVVGFEAPSAKLIDCLVNGRAERTVISVVGMGGLGKSTLAKKVFDSKEVTRHFDCRAWITVSQSYTGKAEEVKGLLRDLLREFHKQQRTSPPQDIFGMDRKSLIDEVRNYLQNKRYVLVFDDVWKKHFWDEIEFAVIDDKNGSKIIITTRNMDVALSCKSFVGVHELQPLTRDQSLELFSKKAFRFDFDGCCPQELSDISFRIVEKCKGLPLAIVAIGGLLSAKKKNTLIELQRFNENLSLELQKDSLDSIKRILAISYHDLSYNLKSCLMYFGIYPEDYEVKSNRLIRQWIAEGFVKEERGKTLEEVAEEYLTELIHRSLVQVSSISIDGKAKGCCIHDLIRVMILEKIEGSSFCHHITENGESSLSETIRRLSIATGSSYRTTSIESSQVRSLLVFTKEEFSVYFLRRITSTYKLLKVLDFEETQLFNFPENLGSLIHLKYLSFKKCTWLEEIELPKSIGLLQNLETLDLRHTCVKKIPKEICKLRKLQHLLCFDMSLIQLKDGIGGMTSLQTLYFVSLHEDGVELIRELGKLKQLRKLGLTGVTKEHGSALSFLMNEMQRLEKLNILSKSIDEVNDLHFIPSLPMLRKLVLHWKFEKLPEWIPKLQNLVKLHLGYSQLTDDPMKYLKNMENLLSLWILDHAYEGESLHFQDEGFRKLKELYLHNSDNLNSIIIDKGALHSLKELSLIELPQIKTVPTGIQHLKKLEVLNFWAMPTELVQSIASDEGKEHWIIEHVPHVGIYP